VSHRPDYVEAADGRVWDVARIPVLVALLARDWREDYPGAGELRDVTLLPLPEAKLVMVEAIDARGDTVSLGGFSTVLIRATTPWSLALTLAGR
jgi:hypothetical protein